MSHRRGVSRCAARRSPPSALRARAQADAHVRPLRASVRALLASRRRSPSRCASGAASAHRQRPPARSAAARSRRREAGRADGLWQRVGEYWWARAGCRRKESAWTGKHDAEGTPFPAEARRDYAWSGRVHLLRMRSAGCATLSLPPAHSSYINAARVGSPQLRIRAERPGPTAAGGRPDRMGRAWSKESALRRSPEEFAGTVIGRRRGRQLLTGGRRQRRRRRDREARAGTDDGPLAAPDGRVARRALFMVSS